jgi:hypothetical protein
MSHRNSHRPAAIRHVLVGDGPALALRGALLLVLVLLITSGGAG